MRRRTVFFLVAAIMCCAVIPITPSDLQKVPALLSITYAVLALASLLDGWSRDREERRAQRDAATATAAAPGEPDQPNRPVM